MLDVFTRVIEKKTRGFREPFVFSQVFYTTNYAGVLEVGNNESEAGYRFAEKLFMLRGYDKINEALRTARWKTDDRYVLKPVDDEGITGHISVIVDNVVLSFSRKVYEAAGIVGLPFHYRGVVEGKPLYLFGTLMVSESEWNVPESISVDLNIFSAAVIEPGCLLAEINPAIIEVEPHTGDIVHVLTGGMSILHCQLVVKLSWEGIYPVYVPVPAGWLVELDRERYERLCAEAYYRLGFWCRNIEKKYAKVASKIAESMHGFYLRRKQEYGKPR